MFVNQGRHSSGDIPVRINDVAASSARPASSTLVKRLRLHGGTFVRDAVVIAGVYVAAETARFEPNLPHRLWLFFLALPVIVLVHSVLNYCFGIHRRVWEYSGIHDIRALVDASALSALVLLAADVAAGAYRPVPISVVLVGAIFAVVGLASVRLWPRLSSANSHTHETATRVLIVGAGQAGQLLAMELRAARHTSDQPVAFLDDDPRMDGKRIHGIPVLGSIERLAEIVREQRIDSVAVAIPSATTRDLDRILTLAEETNVKIRILPSHAEVLAGRSPTAHLRDINLDALLDRIPSSAALEGSLVQDCVRDRIVLVTGGAGSIGSELCRQLIALGPKQVLALDNNESGLFHLQQELADMPGGELLSIILASVTADLKVGQIFERYRPDIVFHAAAYKHVPLLESNADEAVFVNVKGTLNLCRWAAEIGCERFVFVSTDKAVHPVNTLGFSKRIGELLVRSHQQRAEKTIFCCVRFGNVIGSRGSALPEFIRQIDAGGPVRVTHPDVERYFMTIPEAVSLVIQAGALACGGELFMLDMGKPIRIEDLVKRLIRLRGLRVGTDIEITYTGLRPGEKLTEDLVFEAERTRPTLITSVHAVEDQIFFDLDYLERSVHLLVQIALSRPEHEVLDALSRIARGHVIGRPQAEAMG
jgi:FlaA1/EpsC-like NDP-sugar epimerase